MNRRRLAQVEQFRQSFGVLAIVLVVGSKDQSQASWMRYEHTIGYWPQQVVKVAVSAARFITDFKSIGQPLQERHHLIDRSHLRAVGNLPRLVQNAKRDAFAVDIESDVEHRRLPKPEFVKQIHSSTLPI